MFQFQRSLVAFLLHLGIGLSFALPASAEIVFVGPSDDPDCDYETIQAAIDAWAVSPSKDFVSVFIANTQSYTAQALTIPTPAASAGIELRGEFPGCRFAAPSGRTVIDGSGGAAAPVIDIEGSLAGDAARFEVILSQIEVTGGDHTGANGGGVRLRGNAVLTVADARIHGNEAANGAGIAVEATAAGVPHLILLGNQGPAAIVDNAATDDGGGLYCSAATMYCDRYCLIAGNSAGGNGGGIAQQDCGTGLYLPTSSGKVDPDVGLRANTAAGHGGGAWVSSGWLNLSSSEPQRPAPVVGNVAGGSGGGLYFTGLPAGGATNMHRGVQFDDNRAGGDGGAVYADSGFLMLHAPGGAGCAGSTDGCPRFRANHADLVGGAIALSGDASALVSDVMFSGNDASVASVLALGGAPAGVTLTNVQIAGNHGAGELLQSAGGYVDLRYATVADNGGDDAALIRLDAPASLALRNSILHDDNGGASGVVVDAASGSTFSIDCVLVHDDSGLAGEPGVVNLLAADPQWDASAIPAGLYAPGPDSPAVDACDAGPGVIPDLLGEPRPRDLPKPDGAGPFDMGVIERRDDRLFMDGFELS